MKTANTDKVPVRHPETSELAQVRILVEEVMGQVYRHLLGGVSFVPVTLEPWFNSLVQQRRFNQLDPIAGLRCSMATLSESE